MEVRKIVKKNSKSQFMIEISSIINQNVRPGSNAVIESVLISILKTGGRSKLFCNWKDGEWVSLKFNMRNLKNNKNLIIIWKRRNRITNRKRYSGTNGPRNDNQNYYFSWNSLSYIILPFRKAVRKKVIGQK